jgi:hypothetical protein
MESDFNKLKKIMSEEGQAVPPGFAWEDNKDAIFAKMQAMQKQTTSKKRSLWIILLVLLLISISTCTAIFLRQDKNSYVENELKGFESAPVSKPPYSAEIPVNQDNEQSRSNRIASSNQDAPSRTERKFSKSHKTTPDNTRKATTTTGENFMNNDAPYDGSTKNQNSEEIWSNIGDQGSKISVLNERDSFLTLEALDPIDQIKKQGVQTTTQDENILPIKEASVAKSKNSQKAGWIQFSGGLALWNEGYGSSAPERSAYENTLPSYFGRLSYQHVLQSGWTISLGIQYIRLHSEFERTFDIEDYTIVLKDTIIKVQTNSLTGEHQTIRGIWN